MLAILPLQELSQVSLGKDSTFRAACEYKLFCDTFAVDAQPYPTCHDSNWGPAWPHVQYYGLEPSHEEGVLSVSAPAAPDGTIVPVTSQVCRSAYTCSPL
ncbi:unnamed protein product [Protopolystoma xenopodis]|uniref:Uncharacterized protein n=1 Tax=Protopolystoma xenopodis TaxID=117903 RepID=A0A448WQS5_9PLAT|nr:unnamed protein product [Protopolystoma xenopodis]